MKPDLEARLRRAAQLLDDEATTRLEARSSASPAESTSSSLSTTQTTESTQQGRSTRHRWVVLAAAASLAIVGVGGVLVVQSQRDSSTTPAVDSTPGGIDTFEEGWNELPAAPIDPRYGHVTVPTDTGIFVWGGAETAEALLATGPVEMLDDGAFLDLTAGTWQQTPEFPFDGTTGAAAATWVDDRVVLVTQQLSDGAPTDGPATSDMSDDGPVRTAVAASYDPATNTWEALPPPPLPTTNNWLQTGAFAVDGHAVFTAPAEDDESATGCATTAPDDASGTASEPADTDVSTAGSVPCGEDGSTDTPATTVAVYDVEAGTWSTASPPNNVEIGPLGTTAGQELVFVGDDESLDADTDGADCQIAMYRFEPATDTWTSIDVSRQPPALMGTTWTGDAVFSAVPRACAEPMTTVEESGSTTEEDVTESSNDETSRDETETVPPTGRLTSLDGRRDTTVDAPKYVSAMRGWWTGASVAVVSEDGLPMFYDVEADAWHVAERAPSLPSGGGPSMLGQLLGPQFVWWGDAMIAWSGLDLSRPIDDRGGEPTIELMEGGLAYVPPSEFLTE